DHAFDLTDTDTLLPCSASSARLTGGWAPNSGSHLAFGIRPVARCHGPLHRLEVIRRDGQPHGGGEDHYPAAQRWCRTLSDRRYAGAGHRRIKEAVIRATNRRTRGHIQLKGDVAEAVQKLKQRPGQ